jgi:ubiquinone/menaquinone biosynthesis C-methylase UbiE
MSEKTYTDIANDYDLSLQEMPYRRHVEEYSTLKGVGDIQGLRVLDMACGTGHYTRRMREKGAAYVMGVDVSPGMVEVARRAEETTPLGNIEYVVRDAGNLGELGTFDLAIGVYLLHYATSEEHLHNICKGVARNLKPGGRFFTYVMGPTMCTTPDYYLPYKLKLNLPETLIDGAHYTFAFNMGDNKWSPQFDVYYWSKSFIEQAFEQAGFENIQWQDPEISPEGMEEHGAEFWQRYVDIPHCLFISGTRRA